MPLNRAPRRVCASGALIVGLALLHAAPAAAQTDALGAARALERSGRFAEAADSVRSWLDRHPDDPGVRWLLARYLHWSGDAEGARLEYQRAAEGLPGEAWLRLDQVAALMDLRRFEAALAVLDVVTGMRGADPAARARARTLRGTIAYWRGDLPEAAALYEEALARSPDDRESRANLGEIRAAARPWTRLDVGLWSDNQPYRRGQAELEVGTWLNPLWAVAVRAGPGRLDPGAASSTGTGRVRANGYLPGAGLEVEGALGLEGGSMTAGTRTSWTGEARIAFRVRPAVRAGVRAWRERYLWTATSADTLLVVKGVEAAFDAAGAEGWAGEAVARREALPDGNAVGTLYGWILAPLARWLRAGYAVSYQDSDASSWVPADSTGRVPGLPGHGPGARPGAVTGTDGAYVPYFTPEATHVHALLGEVTVPFGPATLRLDASWGIDAVEQAPYAVQSGTPGLPVLSIDFAERSFRPWTVRGGLTIPTGRDGDVRLEVERGRTAFYRATSLSVGWLRRLGSAGSDDP